MKAVLGISTKMVLILLTLINFVGCDVASSDSGNSSSSGYTVVDTGQAKCYDDNGIEIACPGTGEAFYGQDAQYASSNLYVANTANDGGGTLFGVNFADGRIKTITLATGPAPPIPTGPMPPAGMAFMSPLVGPWAT